MSLKTFLKDYFNFSRTERLGILALCVCIVLMITIKWATPYLIKNKAPDTTAFADEIAQFRLAVDLQAKAKDNAQTEEPKYEQTIAELFYFDPNHANDADWNKLGLNQRQIRNIRNYQAAGGSFKRKEDLQKLYTISATQYRQLEPYIRIKGNEPTARQKTPKTSKIELNSADSSLLTQLYGIGPVLAVRTLKYRNLIGGFVEVAQMSEVYGINAELVDRLAAQLSIDSSLIKKIPVNKATFNELLRHPYISEQQARVIINYRRLQNSINNIVELVQNNILERDAAKKIRPYLSFE